MSIDPNDRHLENIDDDDLDAIERELREAAKSHKIEFDEDELPAELAQKKSETDDEFELRLRELDKRAQAILHRGSESSHLEDDEPQIGREQAELEAKLAAVEKKAAGARSTKETRLSKDAEKEKQDRSSAMGLGVGMSIAYSIIGLPIVGFGIGLLIDNANHTNQWRNWLALAGIIVGMAFGIYQLQRFQNKM